MTIKLQTLFGKLNNNDQDDNIKAFFNIIYNDKVFVPTINNIINKKNICTDGAYCFFPNMESIYDDDHFIGVMFSVGNDNPYEGFIIVSEETCFHYVRLASELYLQKHPEDTEKVNEILFHIPE